MGLSIDLERRTVALSPAALLGGFMRRIGFDRSEPFERLWIGQAVHQRVLSEHVAAIPGYACEKGVRFTFPVDDFTVTFDGRLDGRFEEQDGTVVVDEVKSLHFAEDLPRLPGSARMERFQLQLRWYLHGVAESERRAVRGRLVLADIETGATKLVPVSYTKESVLADLTSRVRELLEEFFEARALAEAKAAEAETLPFPFPRWRPGQHEMAAAVARAASQGDHLLVEAPTGIGKTAAALHPLLKETLRSGRKLFILTAKNTQQEIFTRTLDAIGGDSFRSVRLRAKERMCANDVILCHEEHCSYAKDYGDKLATSGLLDRLLSSRRHLEPDTIFEEARNEVVCPFEVSLELALAADVVIGDYNYVFDPIVSLSGAKDPSSLADAFLLVDEAHNLVDRGRGYYSPELVDSELAALERDLVSASPRCLADALEGVRSLRDLVEDAAASVEEDAQAPPDAAERGEPLGGAPAGSAIDLVTLDPERLDDVRLALDALLVRHLADLKAGDDRVPKDPVLALYFTYAGFHDTHRLARPGGRPDQAFDVLVERAAVGNRLAILCKDPSGLLGPIVNGAATTIAMSATLTPSDFYRDLLGFDRERTDSLKLRSPFPKENRLVRVASAVDTRYSAREAAVPKVAALVAELCASCPGNVLALFPSYRFLDGVRARLPMMAARRVLRPSDRSTELERGAVLSALRDTGPPVLLLAVSGGPFAEGVDYPGEMLQGVLVISPALPQVRFEQERMREYFEERYERGFEYAYVIPGMTRVVQSAGRLIRSETDTGVIVLACRRFLQAPYRRYLPAEWYDATPDELAETDLAAAAGAFFERVRRGELPVAEPAGAEPLLPARGQRKEDAWQRR